MLNLKSHPVFQFQSKDSGGEKHRKRSGTNSHTASGSTPHCTLGRCHIPSNQRCYTKNCTICVSLSLPGVLRLRGEMPAGNTLPYSPHSSSSVSTIFRGETFSNVNRHVDVSYIFPIFLLNQPEINLQWIFLYLNVSFLFLPSFSPSKSFESISCPTNAVYPLGCETSAASSHWLLKLSLLCRSLSLWHFFKDFIKKLVAVQARGGNGRLLIICLQEWGCVAYSFPAFADEGHSYNFSVIHPTIYFMLQNCSCVSVSRSL